MQLFSKKYPVGLVLSGGAVRGIAHLGVLKALQENNRKIGIISASSAGAIAGAFFAHGYPPEEILHVISTKKIYDLVQVSIPRTGFFKIEGLKKLLKKYLTIKNIEDLPIPLIVTATNLFEGKIEYLSQGPLINSLIASSSIPALFEVTKLNKIPYVDGGITDNLPLAPLMNKCKKIIAVNVNPIGIIDKVGHPAQIAERAFHLAIDSEIKRKKGLVNIFIEPQKLTDYSMYDLRKAEEIFQIGYEEAKAVLERKK